MKIAATQGSALGFFEELYAIVVGLGLALAVEQVIDLERAGIPVATEHVLVFLAYLNIAFALAHASIRYLQLAYEEEVLGAFGRGRVLGDLVLGLGHFLWLMALSFLITRPDTFAFVAIVLLIGRPGRDAALRLAKRPRLEFDRTVALVHVATIVVLIGTLLIRGVTDGQSELWTTRVGVFGASLVFGLGMYLFGFRYFFPHGR